MNIHVLCFTRELLVAQKKKRDLKKPKPNKVAESIREIITSIHKAQREAKLSQSIQDSLATS